MVSSWCFLSCPQDVLGIHVNILPSICPALSRLIMCLGCPHFVPVMHWSCAYHVLGLSSFCTSHALVMCSSCAHHVHIMCRMYSAYPFVHCVVTSTYLRMYVPTYTVHWNFLDKTFANHRFPIFFCVVLCKCSTKSYPQLCVPYHWSSMNMYAVVCGGDL